VAAQLRLNRNPSVHDSLTGLTNFSQFRTKLSEAFARTKRENKSFALAIGDIDFFGDINENHGQVFGNSVLQSVAAEIRNCVRNGTDVTARYHADAFVMIIHSDNRKNISDMVERIRANVSDEDFETEDGEVVPVTMSFGVTLSSPEDENAQALLERAERALVAAQRAGHNRVEID
jgi:diguanylate cyclase (GGDEF)-like protein